MTLLAGAALVLSLPLPGPAKTGMLVLWILRSGMELRQVRQGMTRVDRLRIDGSGGFSALRSDAPAQPLELLQGSVVLSRVAWFRLRFQDGLQYGELLAGSWRDRQWRRLQRAWRHRAVAFGGPRLS